MIGSSSCGRPGIALAAGVVVQVALGLNAHADVIVQGGSSLFPAVVPVSIETTPDVGNSDIYVGRINIINGLVTQQLNGSLTVNANGSNTEVRTTGGLFVGIQSEAEGTVNVVGDGTANSASATTGRIIVGGSNSRFSESAPFGTRTGIGRLNISNGARVSVEQPTQNFVGSMTIGDGSFSNSIDANGVTQLDGIVSVDGTGSQLKSEAVFIGEPGKGISGQLNVTNGAEVILSNVLDLDNGVTLPIGDIQVAENSEINLSGTGSTISTDISVIGVGLDRLSGPNNPQNAPGKLNITNGATFNTGATNLGFRIGVAGAGQVLLEGNGTSAGPILNLANGDMLIGSSLVDFDPVTNTRFFKPGSGLLDVGLDSIVNVAGDIFVGGANHPISKIGTPVPGVEAPSSGVLNVHSFGTLNAQNVFVDTNGVLKGHDGFINADVTVRGGTVQPGSSPGDLFVTGNLDLLEGLMEIEIAGMQVGEYDRVFVSGDLFVSDDFLFNISFIGNYVPKVGDAFNIFEVLGRSNLDMSRAKVAINGLPPELALSFGSGGFGFNVAAAQIPAPGAFWIMAFGLFGVAVWNRRSRRGRIELYT